MCKGSRSRAAALERSYGHIRERCALQTPTRHDTPCPLRVVISELRAKTQATILDPETSAMEPVRGTPGFGTRTRQEHFHEITIEVCDRELDNWERTKELSGAPGATRTCDLLIRIVIDPLRGPNGIRTTPIEKPFSRDRL